MLTVQGGKLLNACILYRSSDDLCRIKSNGILDYKGNGNDMWIYGTNDCPFELPRKNSEYLSTYGVRMYLGTGNDVPAATDTWLSSTAAGDIADINTVVVNINCIATPSASGVGILYTYAFLNTGLDSYSITEFGLCLSTGGQLYLVAHCVVPERIVAPNEYITFSYELSFQ